MSTGLISLIFFGMIIPAIVMLMDDGSMDRGSK